MVYSFKHWTPVIHQSAFVHPQAAITGNVIIGKDVYIGPGAALRGDWGGILIEDGCNVQENCTIHMFPGITVVLKEGAHIGHGAIILPGRTIGNGAVIAAGAVVTKDVAPYTIVAGVAAKEVKRRFTVPIADALQTLAWWDWEHEQLQAALPDFRALRIEAFIEKYLSR